MCDLKKPNVLTSTKYKFTRFSSFICMWTLLIIVLSVPVNSEVIIKESKVDPFSMILQNQKYMLERIDKISSKLNSLTVFEKRFKELENKYDSEAKKVDAKMKNLQSNLNHIDFKITILSSQLTNNNDSWQHKIVKTVDSINSSISKLFLVCNRSVQDNAMKKDLKELNHKTKLEESSPFKKLLAPPSIFIAKDDDKPIQVSRISSTIMENDQILSQSAINLIQKQMNSTQDKIFRILALMHNVEYRQHISSITQDRRLGILLNKLIIHQEIIENRITTKVQEKIGNLEKGFMTKMTDALNDFQETTNPTANNETSDANKNIDSSSVKCTANKTEHRLPHSTPSKDSNEETIAEFFTNDLTTESSLPKISQHPAEPYPILASYHHNAASLQDSLTTKREINPTDLNYENKTEETVLEGETTNILLKIVEDDLEKENDTVVEALKQSKAKQEGTIVENYATSPDVVSLEKLTNLFNKQIQEMKDILSNRMEDTDEKLKGIQILQSSESYKQTKDIRYELEIIESNLKKEIESENKKLWGKFDSIGKSMYAFIDAAVTSVSSAAVASAKSMAHQISQQLKSMHQFQHSMKNMKPLCPDFYQRVGTTCLLELDIKTSWKHGCQICHALGGTLVPSDRGFGIHYIKRFSNLNQKGEGIWLKSINSPSCTNNDQEVFNNSMLINNKLQLINETNSSEKCPTITPNDKTVTHVSCGSHLRIVCQYTLEKCYQERNNEVNLT